MPAQRSTKPQLHAKKEHYSKSGILVCKKIKPEAGIKVQEIPRGDCRNTVVEAGIFIGWNIFKRQKRVAGKARHPFL